MTIQEIKNNYFIAIKKFPRINREKERELFIEAKKGNKDEKDYLFQM